MACSIECYKEYMSRIEKSRNSVMEQNTSLKNEEDVTMPKPKKTGKRKIADSEITSEDNIVD